MSSSARAPNAKVVLLGPINAGKSCLSEYFLHQKFSDHTKMATVGAAYVSKLILLDTGRAVCIGLWDTAGSEVYRAMTRLYYRDAKAAVVCFEINSNASFESAQFWISELREVEESCKIYLCATKFDLIQVESSDGTRAAGQAVSSADICKIIEETGAKYFETSSKTGYGVQNLFQQIAQDFADDPANLSLFSAKSSGYSFLKVAPKLTLSSPLSSSPLGRAAPPDSNDAAINRRCCSSS